MKILLDTCVWGGVKTELLAAGHDAVWIGDSAYDPGDPEILALAAAEGRVLVTLDNDFGELLFFSWPSPLRFDSSGGNTLPSTGLGVA